MFFVQAEDAFHELEQIEKDTLALRVRQRRAVRVESRLVSGIVLYSLLGFLLTFCGMLVLLYTLLPEWHWALRLALCAPLVLFFPFWCAQLALASPLIECWSAAAAHSCSGSSFVMQCLASHTARALPVPASPRVLRQSSLRTLWTTLRNCALISSCSLHISIILYETFPLLYSSFIRLFHCSAARAGHGDRAVQEGTRNSRTLRPATSALFRGFFCNTLTIEIYSYE